MATPKDLLKQALSLPPDKKVQLVDQLLSSLDEPDKAIDALWAKEAENRIDAYERGELKTVSIEEVLRKYTK